MFNRKDNKESDKELRLLVFVYMQLSKGCALQLSLFDASASLWSSSGTSWASILCCTVVPSLCSDVHPLLNHANHILPTKLHSPIQLHSFSFSFVVVVTGRRVAFLLGRTVGFLLVRAVGFLVFVTMAGAGVLDPRTGALVGLGALVGAGPFCNGPIPTIPLLVTTCAIV